MSGRYVTAHVRFDAAPEDAVLLALQDALATAAVPFLNNGANHVDVSMYVESDDDDGDEAGVVPVVGEGTA